MQVKENDRGGYSIAVNGQLVGNYATRQGAQAVIDINNTPGALRALLSMLFGQ
jgi:hypothetical protein